MGLQPHETARPFFGKSSSRRGRDEAGEKVLANVKHLLDWLPLGHFFKDRRPRC